MACAIAARAHAHACSGFTLLELLCALAIAAVLLLLSGATIGGWIPRYQQRNAAAALAYPVSEQIGGEALVAERVHVGAGIG